MRTQVIPAQITTVEDKIAGNLNLTQILLLLFPFFVATGLYAMLPTQMEFNTYKVIISLSVFLLAGLLALRIKNKLILDWLKILMNFWFRPQYYLFDKNDNTSRLSPVLVNEVPQHSKQPTQVTQKAKAIQSYGTSQIVAFEQFVRDQKLELVLSTNQRGGLSVAFEQVKTQG
jgi:hypothetical protein